MKYGPLTKIEHGTWQKAKGHRIFKTGDKMYVRLPGKSKAQPVTFRALVEDDDKPSYLEVIDKDQRRRCINPTAFVRGA